MAGASSAAGLTPFAPMPGASTGAATGGLASSIPMLSAPNLAANAPLAGGPSGPAAPALLSLPPLGAPGAAGAAAGPPAQGAPPPALLGLPPLPGSAPAAPPPGGGLGAMPPMGSLAGAPPAIGGGLGPMGAPPSIGGGLGGPMGAPPSIPPVAMGAAPGGPPMFGLPPLPGGAPPAVAPPGPPAIPGFGASPGAPAMPPPVGFGGAPGALPAMPPPMGPGALGSAMPGMPPPVPPPGADLFGASGDPFASGPSDPFASAPSDPFGGTGGAANPFQRASAFGGPAVPPSVPGMPPAVVPPGMQPGMPPAVPPLGAPSGATPAFGAARNRPETAYANAAAAWQQPAPPPMARPGTVGPWNGPAAPVNEAPTETRQALGTGRPRLMITQLDGTEQGEVALNEGENLIGRESGGMFAEDNLLSSRHATIIVQNGAAWVRDEGSRNGVYARVPARQHIELQDGDQFCMGRIILRFEFRPSAEAVGYLQLVVGRDVDKSGFPYPIPPTGLTLGRSRSDLRFPKDGWVSGIHCQILPAGGQVMLVDLKSSNGTYLRIRGSRALNHGDALLMGQRIFHVQLS